MEAERDTSVPATPGLAPGPDEILDDLLCALKRTSALYAARLEPLSLREFECLGKVAVSMANVERTLRSPLDGKRVGKAGTEELRGIVARLEAEEKRKGEAS